MVFIGCMFLMETVEDNKRFEFLLESQREIMVINLKNTKKMTLFGARINNIYCNENPDFIDEKIKDLIEELEK